MDLLTGGLILGGIVVAAKVFGGSSGGGKAGTTTTTVPDCSTPKDCDALYKCATPILAKATAADVTALSKMASQAAMLGCTDLAKQIKDAVFKLGKPGGDGGVSVAGEYHLIAGIGTVTPDTAKPGDMLIVALTDAANSKKYITPLAYTKADTDSTGMATFERILSDLAVGKFMKTDAGKALPPFLGAGAIFVGAPPDLADGMTFNVRFAGFPSPGLGNVAGVVTKAQMESSSLASSAALTDAFALAGEDSVSGEEDFLAPQGAFGGGFGQHQRNIGSNFGGRSRFGGKTSIGG